MKKISLFILTILFLSCNNGGNIQNMTGKLDQLDNDELQTMIAKAKIEIEKENFSSATDILDKATIYVTDKDAEKLLAETQTYCKNQKYTFDEKIRKEKERQRQLAELRRQEELNRTSSYSSSNSYDYNDNQSDFCYKITNKDTNPFHNKITYTIECGNGNTKFIKYDPDKYPSYGIIPSFGSPDFKYKSLDEAAKSYCDCD